MKLTDSPIITLQPLQPSNSIMCKLHVQMDERIIFATSGFLCYTEGSSGLFKCLSNINHSKLELQIDLQTNRTKRGY